MLISDWSFCRVLTFDDKVPAVGTDRPTNDIFVIGNENWKQEYCFSLAVSCSGNENYLRLSVKQKRK